MGARASRLRKATKTLKVNTEKNVRRTYETEDETRTFSQALRAAALGIVRIYIEI